MSAEELAAQREAAQAERRPFRIRSPWRDRDEIGNEPFVVRLKAPQEGETVIEDQVRAVSPSAIGEIDDFVLLPLGRQPRPYMLAVVVDDQTWASPTSSRGDDHLNNAFRQLAIIRAMGWPEPVYGHVPLIHGQDGRSFPNDTGRSASTITRRLGILPEALFNYLLRLGWGMATKRSSRAPTPSPGSTSNMSAAPPPASSQKLESSTATICASGSGAAGALAAPKIAARTRPLLAKAMPFLTPRAKDLNELVEGAAFLFKRARWSWTRQARAC